MKTNKTLLALALGATVAPAAFGQINLYLTGSSAFANNIRQCITNSVLVPGATMMTVARTAANGSSIADGTTCWAISGTLSSAAFVDASIRGQTITIYDAYAGSSEGIRDLKNNYTIEYVNLSGSPKLTSRSGADAALTDVQLEADIPPAKTTDFEAGTRTNICVQTFVYLKNFGPLMGGLGSGVKNITRDQALALFTQSGIMNPLFIGGGDNAFDPAQRVPGVLRVRGGRQ